MSKYISANSLMRMAVRFCSELRLGHSDNENYLRLVQGMEDGIRALINEAPEADVAPVIHATWQYDKGEGLFTWIKCSNCGYSNLISTRPLLYCPDCGARMGKKIDRKEREDINMKIYISGPITNDPDYEAHFCKAEKYLNSQGYTAINPCKNKGFEYREYIDMGLCELMRCDTIYMLKGWENSKGANLELHYAEACGLVIWFEGGAKIRGSGFEESTIC